MDWISNRYLSFVNFEQVLNWIRFNAAEIIIVLLFFCLLYLMRISRRLGYISQAMRDVKWVSSRENRADDQ